LYLVHVPGAAPLTQEVARSVKRRVWKIVGGPWLMAAAGGTNNAPKKAARSSWSAKRPGGVLNTVSVKWRVAAGKQPVGALVTACGTPGGPSVKSSIASENLAQDAAAVASIDCVSMMGAPRGRRALGAVSVRPTEEVDDARKRVVRSPQQARATERSV